MRTRPADASVTGGRVDTGADLGDQFQRSLRHTMLSYEAQVAELQKLSRLENAKSKSARKNPRLAAPSPAARCLVCGAAPASACASCQSVHYCGEGHQELDARFHHCACDRLREIREDEAFRASRSIQELSEELLARNAGARGRRALEGWDAYFGSTAFTEPAHRRVLTDLASRPLTIARLLHEFGVGPDRLVRVHVMAASAKELESLTIYQELGALFPEHRFDITMIGPKLPVAPLPPGACVRLRAEVYRRASWSEIGRPHLIVGFDAGLLLYRTWGQTMPELLGSGVATAITSYRSWEASAEAAVLRGFGAVPLCTPQRNPFASQASRRSTTLANDVSRDNAYLSVWR